MKLFTLNRLLIFKLFCIFSLLIIGQLVISLFNGNSNFVYAGGDTENYLLASREFPSMTESRRQGYLNYILSLKFAALFGDPKFGIILFQIFLVYLSAIALFWNLKNEISEFAAWVAVFIYLLNPLMTRWTRSMLTESLYFAFIILILWGFFNYEKSRTKNNLALLIGITLCLTFFRPNGPLVALAVF